MTNITYNEFQPGQGVSAPALNENFALTNTAIENMQILVNETVSTLTSTTSLKANKNGSSSEKFNVADATSDTNAVSLRQLNSAVSPLSPVGSIIWYAGSSAPDGYLLCDGRTVSRTTYAALFGIIGIKYGAGDSTTTFNLPNLINRFIQGANSSGTYKSAGLPNITGTATPNLSNGEAEAIRATFKGALYILSTGQKGQESTTHAANKLYGFGFDASKSNGIYGASNTVQPPALTLLPCIRY